MAKTTINRAAANDIIGECFRLMHLSLDSHGWESNDAYDFRAECMALGIKMRDVSRYLDEEPGAVAVVLDPADLTPVALSIVDRFAAA